MASKQLQHMNELYAFIKGRLLKPDINLTTRQDIVENRHSAASEPEAVAYAGDEGKTSEAIAKSLQTNRSWCGRSSSSSSERDCSLFAKAATAA